MEITTHDLQKLYDLRQEILRIAQEQSILKQKRDSLQVIAEEREAELLRLVDRGATIKSLKFAAAVKMHNVQAYINWQKEYRANHPKEYDAIKEEKGKEEIRELRIAQRSTATKAELDALLGV